MTQSFAISFHPFNVNGRFQKGTTIFNAAQRLDVPLRSDCGQKGTCGKCSVRVDTPDNLSPVASIEKKRLKQIS